MAAQTSTTGRAGTGKPRLLGRPNLVLGVAFAISRLLYGWAGVDFDARGLNYLAQLVDPTVLQDRLAESIWYLHAQPPAFNLFIGGVLRWSPLPPGTSLQLAYLACGLVLLFSLHDLVRRLGLGPRAALIVTLVICCSPTTVLFENWVSYEYPVATMLVVLVDLVARFGATPTSRRLFVGAMCVASLAVLTRSLFHPLWLLTVFACLALYHRPIKRVDLLLAALPMLVVALVIAKNEVLFGTQLTSWFGYSAHQIVESPLTDEQRQQLAAEGFVPVDPGPCVVTHPDVPALAEPYKRVEGGVGQGPIKNYNFECLIGRYQGMQTDAARITRAHPGWVARNVAGSTEIWAVDATFNPFVYENRDRVGTADEVYRRTVMLDVSWDPPVDIPTAWPVRTLAPDQRFHVTLTIVVATVAVSVAGALALLRWRRRDPRALALLVGGWTIFFVNAATILLEFGENNRIRYVVEPLTLALGAVLVGQLVTAVRRRRGGRTADEATSRA